MCSTASIKRGQGVGRSCIFTATSPIKGLPGLFIITSNVNNRGTNSCTSSRTIASVIRRVQRSTSFGPMGMVHRTVRYMGARVLTRTRRSRGLEKVKAAVITTAVMKRCTCITGMNSDELCIVKRGVRRVAESRSLIRRVMEVKRLSPRRTEGRPGGGVVAETLKTRGAISVSFFSLGLRPKSMILVYSSKLDGVIRSDRLERVVSSASASLSRGNEVLVERTGHGNNGSGVTVMLMRPFASRIGTYWGQR